MNLYRIEMKLAASIYVKAESESEALKKVEEFSTDCFEFTEDEVICGRQYTDPKMPEISLSPAMTGLGLSHPNGSDPDIECVEEDL